MLNFRKTLLAGAAGIGLVASLSSYASATPQFTVDPAAVPGSSGADFNANDINGVSSALITELTGSGGPGSTQSEEGYIQFTNYTNNSNTETGLIGLGATYNLFLTFTATTETTSGTVGSAGNQNQITSLNFTLFVDPQKDDTTTNASVSPATPASVNTNGNDIVLATGSLISGVASFNSSGGPAFNALLLLDLCNGAGTAEQGSKTIADASCTSSLGTSYFVAPVPFFDIAFEESNTTPSNLTTQAGFPAAGTIAAINSDTAQVNFTVVPEPASLAIFGAGIVGLGFALRRRKKWVA